jgi:hypothetical protein
MKPEACRRCIGFAETAEDVLAILNSPPDKCAACSDAAVLRVVCDQYQMGSSHWWLVDGALAVPIWVVELLNNHVEVAATTVHGTPRRPRAMSAA